MKTNCAVCSNRSSCFNDLTINELGRISDKKTEISYNKGETIIKQNTFASHIYFVKSGLVKIYMETANKKDLILEIAGKGAMIGITSLNHGNRYKFSVAAITEVKACEIDIEIINNILFNNISFATTIIASLNDTVDMLFSKVQCLSQKNAQARMAELLINFADKIYKAKSYNINLSRNELAELTNIATENVVRILKEFNKEGLIISKGKNIEIIDYDKLKLLSE